MGFRIYLNVVSVAQFGRAPDCGSGGCRFKSGRTPHKKPPGEAVSRGGFCFGGVFLLLNKWLKNVKISIKVDHLNQLRHKTIMTNKTIVIGVIAVLVIVGGAFLLFKSKAPTVVDMGALTSEESELAAFDADLASFAGDEVVLSELDQTLNDVAETTSAISATESIDSTSIGQEGNQVDFSKDLAGFTSDDAALQELDQAFGEVTQ